MSRLAIVAGDAHPALAAAIARELAAELVPASVAAFADGEARVRIEGDVRGRQVLLVQPTSTPTHARLMTLALLADAARAEDAARVGALIPYFGYARQDVRQRPGEPRSASLAVRVLAAAGIDRVLALELHSPALEAAFPMPLVHLHADCLFVPILESRQVTLVSPDAGGMKRAQRFARTLGRPLALVTKARTGADTAVAQQVLGDVRGAECWIVDDMASTGGTIAGAAQALYAAGAREVHAAFVHAVMAEGALERMRAAGVREIVTTDSVGAVSGEVRVLPTAPLFISALRDSRPTARG